MNISRRRGFTLIEMLIVIAIIGILAALIFPSFSAAREDARQKACSSNLREIGLAVQMYRIEEREYPASLAVLLPPSQGPNSSTLSLSNNDDPTQAPVVPTPTPQYIDGNAVSSNQCDATSKTCPNVGGTGYLRDAKYLLCPNDHSRVSQPRSSYGDISTGVPDMNIATPEDLSRRIWNYWGYRDDGVAYNNQVTAQTANGGTTMPVVPPTTQWLVDQTRKYVAPDTDPSTVPAGAENYRTNVVRNSLSNRFAPSTTIVTYCPYHRVASSAVSSPEKLYDPAEAANIGGARDLILRVDGTVKSVVVSSWKAALDPEPNWQNQSFR